MVPRQGTWPARQDVTSVFGWEPVFFFLKRLRRAVYLQIAVISNVYIYLVFHMRIFMTIKTQFTSCFTVRLWTPIDYFQIWRELRLGTGKKKGKIESRVVHTAWTDNADVTWQSSQRWPRVVRSDRGPYVKQLICEFRFFRWLRSS